MVHISCVPKYGEYAVLFYSKKLNSQPYTYIYYKV
nr:MAG TPA: hypothetical protein [Crassvirales sp.]